MRYVLFTLVFGGAECRSNNYNSIYIWSIDYM